MSATDSPRRRFLFVTFDGGGNTVPTLDDARRVEALEAGRVLAADAGVREIRAAVGEVLERPSYREAARRLQAAIASAPGAAGAADDLESVARGPS